jgi:hypothetical protein
MDDSVSISIRPRIAPMLIAFPVRGAVIRVPVVYTLNKRIIFTPNPRIYVFEITLLNLKSKISNFNLYKNSW